jgi:peptide/nickel transport system permease protein
VKYGEWLCKVVRGAPGESLWTGRPVLQELMRRIPVSPERGLMALAFSVLIPLPVGIIAAVHQDTVADFLARSAAILGLSISGYWIATLVVVLPAIWWGWAW